MIYSVSPTGKDTNDGTTAPWLTLQKAANTVQPGDTVNVAAGNYAGARITRSGTASQRITYKAALGVKITTPAGSDGINLEGASYITIDGFNCSNMPRAGIRSASNSGVQIRNNVCDRNGAWGIFTAFSVDVVIENNTCTNSVAQHGLYHSNSADNPIIRNNTCAGNAACGIQCNADASMGGDGIITNALIEGNTLTDNGRIGGAAINLDGVQKSMIRNNVLKDNHASGIALFRIDSAQPSTGNTFIGNKVNQAPGARKALTIQNGSKNNVDGGGNLFLDSAGRDSRDISADSQPFIVSTQPPPPPPPPIDDPTLNYDLISSVRKGKHTGTKTVQVP